MRKDESEVAQGITFLGFNAELICKKNNNKQILYSLTNIQHKAYYSKKKANSVTEKKKSQVYIIVTNKFSFVLTKISY